MFIVTPNYRNRSSEYRWLVRRRGDAPDTARAFREVQMVGVQFILTAFEGDLQVEDGFGCSIVALCANAIGYGPEPQGIVLELRGHHFIAHAGKVNEGVVHGAREVNLTSSGKILAKF